MSRAPTPGTGGTAHTVAAGAFTLLGSGVLAVALVASCRRVAGPLDWSTTGLAAWFENQPVSASFRALTAVALVVLAYLAVGTVASIVATVARATHRHRLGALAEVVTNPLARKAFAAVLGLGMVLGTAAPARATADTEATMRAVGDPEAPVPPSPPPSPPTTAVPAFEGPVHRTWTVEPGDHLWGLTARVLAETWDRPPTDAEIASHLRTIVDANRDRLAVPDEPDLIFPGQVFLVPAPPEP
jgi:nucleoid-associated protein YgaU